MGGAVLVRFLVACPGNRAPSRRPGKETSYNGITYGYVYGPGRVYEGGCVYYAAAWPHGLPGSLPIPVLKRGVDAV